MRTQRALPAGRCRTRLSTLSPIEAGLLVLVIGTLLAAAALSATPRPTELTTTTVRVGAGESLWELAQRHPVRGMSTGQTVDLLAEINELEGAAIAEGAVLKVPASRGSSAVAMR